MNRIFILLVGILFLSSCKIAAPTFKNIGQWQVTNISTSSVTLMNTAYFHNPNAIDGIKLNTVSVNILANGKKLGTIVNPNGKVTIAKNSDFAVPLSLNVNPSDLIGGLGDLLGAALGGSVDIRCLGSVGVGFMMFNKSVTVDQTVPVRLSDIRR